jgi:hypothetical protein
MRTSLLRLAHLHRFRNAYLFRRRDVRPAEVQLRRALAVKPRWERATGFLLCVLLAPACTGEEVDPAPRELVRGSPAELDPIPRLSLGVVEGDTLQEFHAVADPFLLPGADRLVVPLRGANSIRVFGPDGAFEASHGRPGRGPGEFQFLLGAWARGDTIEALDFELRRLTRFLPGGGVESVPVHTDLPDLSLGVGPVPEGWVVGGVREGGPGRRDLMEFRLIGWDGTDLGRVGQVEGMARHATATMTGPGPLSPRAMARVALGRLYTAESLTPRLRVWHPQGGHEELSWEMPMGGEPGTMLREVIAEAVNRAPPDQAMEVRRRLESVPVPARSPLFWGFLVDEEGFVWIRPYEPLQHSFALGWGMGGGGEWMVLAPDGQPVGSVSMPEDLEPTHISSDAVVGVARDAFGVQSVRVHSLRRH